MAAVMLVISGCRFEEAQPSPEEARLQREMWDWTVANTRLAGPGRLRLRDGSCLDLTATDRPWEIDDGPEHGVSGVTIATAGKGFGLRPYERKGVTTSFSAIPEDGKLRVQITGWSPPNPRWENYWAASPERIEQNRRSGLFRQLDLWRDAKGLEAYQGTGQRFYVDASRLTQCRDYLSLERDGYRQVNCTAVSQDRSFSFSFRFDSRDVERLPRALEQIEKVIGATRGRCPTARPSQTS